MSIADNWAIFQDDLAHAAQRYGRGPDEITVMAVSKTRSAREIREARSAGLTLFGENRTDEAADKFEGLDPEDYPLYLIGHLQSGKASRITRRFTGVHSVDSIRIARKLSKVRAQAPAAPPAPSAPSAAPQVPAPAAPASSPPASVPAQSASRPPASPPPLEVLIQVNTSGEESKSGFRDPEEFKDAAAEIAAMPGILFKGVMTMAPFVDNEAIVRGCFAECRRRLEDVKSLISGAPVLSMGMSSDYRWAAAEGSTLLRIGTAIFGNRE